MMSTRLILDKWLLCCISGGACKSFVSSLKTHWLRYSAQQTFAVLGGIALVLQFASLTAWADYPATVLSQGPVAYWRLNETNRTPVLPLYATNRGGIGAAGNGDYVEADRGVAPGAIVGEPADGAVSFAGNSIGNRVRIPYSSSWNPHGPFTIEFWAKPGQTTRPACVAASFDFAANPTTNISGWVIFQADSTLNNGNGFIFRQFSTGGPTTATDVVVDLTLDVALWYHVVAVYDGTLLKLYVNGALGQSAAMVGIPRINTLVPLTFGARAEGASDFFTYTGRMDEAAVYPQVLTPAQIQAHYVAGTTVTPAGGYAQLILGDNPAGYWQFNEAPDPLSSNLGTLGDAWKARFFHPVTTGQPGPSGPDFVGFEAVNRAPGFAGSGSGYIRIPALNLRTNILSLTCWVKPNGEQAPDAGVVMHRTRSRAGATGSTFGLKFDTLGGRGLNYNWDGDNATYEWSSGIELADQTWNFVGLIINSNHAVIYVPGHDPVTNQVNHGVLELEGLTYIGMDPFTNAASTSRSFKGGVDEIAIFHRALSLGEVYSQFAAAKGGLAPKIFAEPVVPRDALFVGDTLTLSVDAGGSGLLSFQWRKGGVDLPGVTSATFTKVLAAWDSGDYSVLISNDFGTISTRIASMVVSPEKTPSFIQDHPNQTRAIFAGGVLKLAVKAEGGAVTYQWKKDGVAVAGETNRFLTLPIFQTNGGVYTVTASNSSGSAESKSVTVTVPSPVTGSYDAAVLADAPAGWWRLDDPSGSVRMLDSMGRADGVWTNLNGQPVALGVRGVLASGTNTAARFDSTKHQWGEVFPPPVTTGDFTFECWARTLDTTAALTPLSSFRKQYGFLFLRSTNNTWRSANGYGDVDVGADYRGSLIGLSPAGKWMHLVSVYSPGSASKTYINGVWDGQGPFVDFSRNRNTPLRVGAVGPFQLGGPSLFWTGEIDEVAVYTKALTGSQILAHYQAVSFGADTSPLTFIRTGGDLELRWQNGVLEQASEIGGWWSPVPGAIAPPYKLTIPATGGAFYRVRR